MIVIILITFVLCWSFYRYIIIHNNLLIHLHVSFSLVQWLEETFLPYLDAWKKSVEAREGFSKEQKNRMLLSRDTRLSLCMTSKYTKFIIMNV